LQADKTYGGCSSPDNSDSYRRGVRAQGMIKNMVDVAPPITPIAIGGGLEHKGR